VCDAQLSTNMKLRIVTGGRRRLGLDEQVTVPVPEHAELRCRFTDIVRLCGGRANGAVTA